MLLYTPSMTRKAVALQALLWMTLLFLLAGCSNSQPLWSAPPTPVPDPSFSGPTPPLKPEAIGSGLGEARSITDMDDAIACLESGQPVYAQVQASTPVLADLEDESCQVGYTSAGSIVRVDGIYQQGQPEPLVSLDRRQISSAPALPVGYNEDIQPLFERTCASCHGGAVKLKGLQVTTYEAIMEGSENGPVIVPGDPEASTLWKMVGSGAMPLVGELSPEQKRLVFDWIRAGAPEERPETPANPELWLSISDVDFTASNTTCAVETNKTSALVRAESVRIASCAAAPTQEQMAQLRSGARSDEQSAAQQANGSAAETAKATPAASDAVSTDETAPESPEPDTPAPEALAVVPSASSPRVAYSPGQARIQAAPLGLPAPSDADPWMVGRGGLCVEQRLQQKLEKNYGITSLAFAPDGRLFMGLDSPSTGEIDPNILFDAFHPSRSIAVYNSNSGDEFFNVILAESSRVTGMTWHGGSLYLNRAGEVGRIPDGGGYEQLAAGFAVNGRLFHANNGIAVANGWLYVSTGGVRDGFSDGLINPGGGDVPAETQAVDIASGGNAYASRLVRTPIDRLLSQRSIGAFQVAARGFRNPYGVTADPFGRIWVTDNGATNVGEEYLAGDEVNLFDPGSLSAEAAAGNQSATPFYGFPLALTGTSKDWWTGPVVPLLNTSAPTAITWAYGTIYYAQYGRNPGLYRLSSSGGQIIAERVLLGWPIQAVTTAPDGAIWIGTGTGGLYRLTAGC